MTNDEARTAAREFAHEHGIDLSPAAWAYIDTGLDTHEARMRGEGSSVPVGAYAAA